MDFDAQELLENKPGLIGVIVSFFGLLLMLVLGIPMLGVIAAAGLIVASRGMREEPKALAIVGMSVGGLGTLLMLILTVFGSPGSGPGPAPSDDVGLMSRNVEDDMIDFMVAIQAYIDEHSNLPADLSAVIPESERLNDPWGNPYQLTRPSRNTWKLLSMGPDGEVDAEDDPEPDDIFVEAGM